MPCRLAFLLVLLAGPALAHFSHGTQVREILVAQVDGEMRIRVRAPLPLVFADTIAGAMAARGPLDSPFLYQERTGGGLRYRVDMERLRTDAPAFRVRLAGTLVFTQGETVLTAEVIGFRLSPRQPQTRLDADWDLQQPPSGLDPVFSDAVVDYVLRLPTLAHDLSVQSGLPAIALLPGMRIDNHVTRQTGRGALMLVESGQLESTVAVPFAPLDALRHSARAGIVNITTDLDHAFLIACFALGLGWSWHLVGVVAAFTLGHSGALILAASGHIVQITGVQEMVEVAIAVSVVLAAWHVWSGRAARVPLGAASALAATVGVLVAFSFAAVLAESLTPGSTEFAPVLAGFNLGQVLGQLVLVLTTLAAFSALGRLTAAGERIARTATLALIGVTAGYWTLQRGLELAVS